MNSHGTCWLSFASHIVLIFNPTVITSDDSAPVKAFTHAALHYAAIKRHGPSKQAPLPCGSCPVIMMHGDDPVALCCHKAASLTWEPLRCALTSHLMTMTPEPCAAVPLYLIYMRHGSERRAEGSGRGRTSCQQANVV